MNAPIAPDEVAAIAYAEIATIAFTGRDTAAGSAWKAWLERKARERAAASHPRPDRT